MRFLKKLLAVLVVIAIAVVGVAFFLPDNVHVERATTIARPPSEVFAVLDSYRRFNDWSPWFELDPKAQYTYSGPTAGVGAKESWVGNKDVGSGSQEIVEAKPNEFVKVALDFGDMGKATATYRLAPEGQGTKLVWGFDSNANGNLVKRLFGLMMDSMIGKDYEKGLAKLKTLVEALPNADVAGVEGKEISAAAEKIYFVSASSSNDPAAIKDVISEAYGKIGAFLKQNGIAMAGAPLTITTSYDASGWKFDAAIPVERNDAAAAGDVQAGSTYAGKAVEFMHVGPYDKLGETIPKAYLWLTIQGYKPKDRLIEEYVSDPGNTPPEQLKTRIVIPVE
ncbi:MAG TPA: SRPBCC family protein [Rudaea sp.]|nr:SRPBCC family protein [Rudaea sp.]